MVPQSQFSEKMEEDPRRIAQNSDKKVELNVILLSNKKRWILFLLMICSSMLSSIDHGTIPAATAQIRFDLEISNTILGLFGSAVYAGTILGSLIVISLINVSNRKYVLIGSIVLYGICLLLFTIKQHYILLFINRGIVGLFQTFQSIYLPVWTDQFGEENKKTMMFALIQLCSPLGIVLGYTMTILFANNYGWKMSFIIEGISSITLAFILGLFPMIYFKTSIRPNKSSDGKSAYFYDEDEVNIQAYESNLKVKEAKGIFKILNQFKVIFREPIYIFSVLTLSTLLYIATCIQYWASDYMLDTLGITDPKKRMAAFLIICLTSTFGVLLIGLVISFCGGYASKKSTPVCLFFCVLLSLSSIPIPLVDHFLWCALSLWLLLFFGGGIIAPLNGIILTSVPKEYAGSANSICHLSYNIFGKLPAPYIYGIIKTHSSGRVAMMVSMWLSFLAVAFLAITTFLRNKNYEKIKKYAVLCEDLKQQIETDMNKIELSDRKPNEDKLTEAINNNHINSDVKNTVPEAQNSLEDCNTKVSVV